MRLLASAALAVALVSPSLQPAVAGERAYFNSVQGTWKGAGKIVNGKYKGTHFTCSFQGSQPAKLGMKIEGSCRVGLFSQPMSAVITKGGNGYRGQFLDGAKGKGLDVVSGRLRSNKLVVGIQRKQLDGTMVANMKSRDKMHITISVKAKTRLVPVIGLTLNRT